MMALGDDDPIKIRALEEMPIVDYFMLLDRKLKEAIKKKKPGK